MNEDNELELILKESRFLLYGPDNRANRRRLKSIGRKKSTAAQRLRDDKLLAHTLKENIP